MKEDSIANDSLNRQRVCEYIHKHELAEMRNQ